MSNRQRESVVSLREPLPRNVHLAPRPSQLVSSLSATISNDATNKSRYGTQRDHAITSSVKSLVTALGMYLSKFTAATSARGLADLSIKGLVGVGIVKEVPFT
jgi:hypothetical protein